MRVKYEVIILNDCLGSYTYEVTSRSYIKALKKGIHKYIKSKNKHPIYMIRLLNQK